MTIAQFFVIVILIVPLALVFMNRLREDVAALAMAVLLGLAQFFGLGVLGPANTPEAATHAIEGFGTPEVVTLMSLFVLTYCLDKYGVTRWLARQLLAIGGRSERRLIGLFAVTAALLSLFMNNLAAGALLLPSALDACRRTGIKPSKLLIPIAYGTMLGGASTYLTTANIVVSSLLPLATPPQPPLGIFDFTPTGGVVAIAGLLFLIVFGKNLLPDRDAPMLEIAPTSNELSSTYRLEERLWRITVLGNTPLVNQTLSETQLGEKLGITVLAIQHHRLRLLADTSVRLAPFDELIVVGRQDRVIQLVEQGLEVKPYQGDVELDIPNTALVEVLVLPRSRAEGKTLQELAFRTRYGFWAVALWRDGWSYRTDVGRRALQAGDTLLTIGKIDHLKQLKAQTEFVILETAHPDNQVDVPRLLLTLAIALSALTALFLGVRVEIAMLAGAVAYLLTGLIQPDEAYGAIKWRAIFLIAGTLSVSTAMVQTGLAQEVGNAIIHFVEPYKPMGLIAGAYLLSAGLTQVMGGQISPLVVGPIVISAAIQLDVNPQAVAVVTAIAGSVSFITPLSHPVNILMIAPANYKFSDFVKSGWLLTIVCFITLMLAVPLFWKL